MGVSNPWQLAAEYPRFLSTKSKARRSRLRVVISSTCFVSGLFPFSISDPAWRVGGDLNEGIKSTDLVLPMFSFWVLVNQV